MPFDININAGLVAEFYDLCVKTQFDIAFWLDTAKNASGPRLELMCGTGRVLLPLVRAGFDVEGLDYSEELLSLCREKAAAEKLTTALYLADAREFRLDKKYGLIYIAFHSIAEVIDDADKLAVLRNARRHLRPDGLFYITIHNPPRRRVNLDGRLVEIGTHPVPTTGEQVEFSGRSVHDPSTGIVSGAQTYRCTRDGKQTRLIELPLRWHLIEPKRLEELLVEAGLTITARFGDYDSSPFSPEDSAFLIVCCTP